MYVFDVILFFNVRLLSVLRDQSFFSSPPQRPMTSDSEGFPSQMLSITFLSYLYSSERASISLCNVECQTRELLVPLHYIVVLSLFFRKSQYFPFEYSVLNKDTNGTIFITSLVWCGPWLGIEPETSRTRSQHSTTRLSRRRLFAVVNL